MLPTPDAVIFDLDGTLVDTVETRIRAWLSTFAELEIPAGRAQVAALIGSDGRRLAREVADAAGQPIDDRQAEEIDRRAGELYGSLNVAPRPLPGARATIEALDACGIPWAIATSSRPEQVAASVAALTLDGAPLIIDGGRVAHAKPAPDLLLLAAEELNAPPDRCWVVGDATWDMRAAVAAGMVAIGVTAGSAVDGAALRAAGASVVMKTLEELPPLLP
ncbi:MAG: HAD family hydrolase [Candidatus Limnocylindria bacterium]